MRNRIRVVQAALGLLVLFFAARTLVRNWDELRSQPLEWQLRPELLGLSILIVWLMYVLLIAGWRTLLHGWGQRLNWWGAARIWVVSNLGKYLPGKLWAVAGMAMLSQRAGVAPWAATASAVVMQVLAIGSGAAVAGLAGADALESARAGTRGVLLLLVIAAAAAVGLLLWPPFLRQLLRLAGIESGPNPIPTAKGLIAGIVTNLGAWVGYGFSLWLLARGLLPTSGLDLRLATAVFTASYLGGFLALFAPGGIGVRESLFILMLQQPLGLAAATSLALASRLLLTVAELGAAVPFLALRRRQARVPS